MPILAKILRTTRRRVCFRMRGCGVGLAAVVVCVSWLGTFPKAGNLTADDEVVRTGARQSEPPGNNFGTFSCAAAACHGSAVPDPASQHGGAGDHSIRRDELVLWMAQDPHAKSRRIVEGKAWNRILENLEAAASAGRPVQREAIESSCIRCHGMRYQSRRASSGESVAAAPFLEGVGCESCHGPSSGWVGIHFRESFQKLTADEKRATGFYDTGPIWDRIQMCARCHIADPDAGVDHRLIAAGHPRLQFDFATYFSRLPAHWNVKHEVAVHGGESDYWPWLWFAGQVVHAETSARQLAARTSPDNSNSAWPEFAEYDCDACHHQIESKNAQGRDLAFRRRGSAEHRGGGPRVVVPASSWPYDVVATIAARERLELGRSIGALRTSLEQSLVPVRSEVHRHAEKTAQQLETWRKSMAARSTPPTQLANYLTAWRAKFDDKGLDWIVANPERTRHALYYLKMLERAAAMTRNSGIVGNAELKELESWLTRDSSAMNAKDTRTRSIDPRRLKGLIESAFRSRSQLRE